MNTIDGKRCFTYGEVAAITGYSEDYVEKSANGSLEGGKDLSDHKVKLGKTTAFLTEDGLRAMGMKDNSQDIEDALEAFLEAQ